MARLTQRFGLSRYEADEYYKKALEAYRKNQLEEALLNLGEAIKLLPRNPEYHAARGFFYLEDGVKDKALADFEEALRQHPYEMLAHYGRGIIAYNDRNWDEALAHFKDASYAAPNRPEVIYYMALTYHRQGENEKALPLMEQAVALFEAANDRRRTDANRWLRELQRLLERQAEQQREREPASRPLIRTQQRTLLPDVAEDEDDEED